MLGGAVTLIIAGLGAGRGVLAHGSDDDDDDHDNSGPGGGGHDDDGDDHHGLPPEQSTQVADVTTVRIVDERFEPNNIVIETGQTVTWENRDDDQHTASGRGMDTGVINPGDNGSVTFLEPGEFSYTCNFHPEMLGLVTVTGESKATPQASPVAAPMTIDVKIVDFAFNPEKAAIAVGGTVTWTNTGKTPHTIYADWAKSDILNTGDTFEYTFDKSGTFEYQCGLHTAMVGMIEVVDRASATPGATPAADLSGDWLIEFAWGEARAVPLRSTLAQFLAQDRIRAKIELDEDLWKFPVCKCSGIWGISKDRKICRSWIIEAGRERFDPEAIRIFVIERAGLLPDGTYSGTVTAHIRKFGSEQKRVVTGTCIGRRMSS